MNAFRGHSWHGCLEMQAYKNTDFLSSEVGTYYSGSPAWMLDCKEEAGLCCGSRAMTLVAMLSITCLRQRTSPPMTVIKIHWLTMSYCLTFKCMRLDKCITLCFFDYHLPALRVLGVILDSLLLLWTDVLLPSLELTSLFWMPSCLSLLTPLLCISSEMRTGDPTLMPPLSGERNFFKPLGSWFPLLWIPHPWALTKLCSLLPSYSVWVPGEHKCIFALGIEHGTLGALSRCPANSSGITARLVLWCSSIEINQKKFG